MARPYWSGRIQISLVSFGVKLFVATEAKSDIRFHQIDRSTGERVRHQKVLASAVERDPDEAADPVDRSRIVKGYEYAKGQYITLEPDELAHLRVPSKHTMEITEFVDESDLSPEFFEKPYFAVPEDDAQTEAFLTVRKALLETKEDRHLAHRLRWPRARRRHRARRHRPARRHDGLHHALRRRAARPCSLLPRREEDHHQRRLPRTRQRADQAQVRKVRRRKVRRQLRGSGEGAGRSQAQTRAHPPRRGPCKIPRQGHQPHGRAAQIRQRRREAA